MKCFCLLILAVIVGASNATESAAAFCDQTAQFENDGTLSAGGWMFVEDSDGIRIYNRESSGSRVREVLAKTVLDGPPWRVFAAISDYDRYAEFMPYVKTSETVRQADGSRWVFQHLAFFFPISDRSYVIKMTDSASRPRDGFYCAEWSLADDGAAGREMPGIVPPVNNGLWLLRPLERGTKTDVSYFLHSDPGGWLPAAIIDSVNKTALPAVIRAVQKRMASAEYDRLDPQRTNR